jgi:cytochrome d ubiquinol oxidase subunit I
MDITLLSRWQFAITTVYHFFFVPLTLGLSVLVAIMETLYVRTGNPAYKQMTRFWGKLFLINYAMGVVTGLVQEFQFGMNWADYSRFMGDIFGAPLAIEALLAFFLESTFLGVWLFGWEKLSKQAHLAAIWCVAVGSSLSALWILVANSFMQQPVGYAIEGGRAVMTDFWALIGNSHVWVQWPHTVLSGFATAGFFVMGISAWHLFRKPKDDIFTRSFRLAAVFGAISTLLVTLVGHSQAQHMVQVQPMKMAAAEALWVSEDPASMSIFSIGDESKQEDVFAIRIPRLLSLLAYNRLDGEIKGIRDLQAEYEVTYGPGNYVPSVFMAYWSFRGMVGAGMLMLLLAVGVLLLSMFNKPFLQNKWFRFYPLAIGLPYLANTTGWLLTEMGRQPWLVFGLLRTESGVSPTLQPGMVLTSLIGFTLLYGILMVADVYLLVKYAREGVPAEGMPTTSEATYWE